MLRILWAAIIDQSMGGYPQLTTDYQLVLLVSLTVRLIV
jgi:hypothetical protein